MHQCSKLIGLTCDSYEKGLCPAWSRLISMTFSGRSLIPIALYSIAEEVRCRAAVALSTSHQASDATHLPLLLLDLLLLDPLGSSSCKTPPPSGQTMCRPLRLRCGVRSGLCFGLAPFSDPDMLPSITTPLMVPATPAFTCSQTYRSMGIVL